MRTQGSLGLKVVCPECGGKARVYKKCRDGVGRCCECKACGFRFKVMLEFRPVAMAGGGRP